MPFDPIERSQDAESKVMVDGKRRYHRFRAAPYYGGITTADAVGCSFLCAFCWNYERNLHPERHGRFYSPQEVAETLLSIARKKGFHLYRITGSEPVLGQASLNHLVEVQKLLSQRDPHYRFVLETNGLMLGYHPEFIEMLLRKNLMVRIALKGVDPESFEKISGAKNEFFDYPIRAVKLCQEKGIDAWPAIMGALFDDSQISKLKNLLASRGITSELEIEYLEKYPAVMKHLKQRGIKIKQ